MTTKANAANWPAAALSAILAGRPVSTADPASPSTQGEKP